MRRGRGGGGEGGARHGRRHPLGPRRRRQQISPLPLRSLLLFLLLLLYGYPRGPSPPYSYLKGVVVRRGRGRGCGGGGGGALLLACSARFAPPRDVLRARHLSHDRRRGARWRWRARAAGYGGATKKMKGATLEYSAQDLKATLDESSLLLYILLSSAETRRFQHEFQLAPPRDAQPRGSTLDGPRNNFGTE